jgi:DeoR/GlpR family transcriptional regulator of sugar metabolism
MCDSTKFFSTSAFKLFPLSKVDYIVTDSPLPEIILASNKICLVNDDPAFVYKLEKKASK